MTDFTEPQEEVACLLGLTLAAMQLARRAAALAGEQGECGMLQVLEQLGAAGTEVQRRCQALIARHAGLRTGRVTATSRRVKAAVVDRCGEGATVQDVSGLLVATVARARISALDLAAQNPPDRDQAVAGFAEFAVSVLGDQSAAITRACGRFAGPDTIRTGRFGN